MSNVKKSRNLQHKPYVLHWKTANYILKVNGNKSLGKKGVTIPIPLVPYYIYKGYH